MRSTQHRYSVKKSGSAPHLPRLRLQARIWCAASTADATAAAVQADEQLMDLALKQAQMAYEAGEVPIGAVLVINRQVVAAAYNLTETKQNPLCHAELLCISAAAEQQLAWRLPEATLYSTIEPCPMCAGAILQARLARLVYGARQARVGADGSWVALFPQATSTPHNQRQGQKQAEQPQQQPLELQQAGAPTAGSSQPTMADQLHSFDEDAWQAHSSMDQQQQQPLQPALKPISPHPFHPNIQVTGGVLADQCAHLMRAFFRRRRKEQKAQAQEAAAAAAAVVQTTSEPQHCTCNGAPHTQQQLQQQTSMVHSSAAAAGTSSPVAAAGQRDDASCTDDSASEPSSQAPATAWCATSLWLGSSSLEEGSDGDSTS